VKRNALDEWINQTGIADPPASWIRYILQSEQCANLSCLPSEDYLRQMSETSSLPKGQLRQMLSIRSKVFHDPILERLFHLWHTILFVDQCASDEAYEDWPMPFTMDDNDAALFRALVISSGTANMERALINGGLPEWRYFCRQQFVHETETHFNVHGIFGLSNNQMWWLWPVFLGRVFPIGRLTYEIAYYSSGWEVFRNKEGRILLMTGSHGQCYDEEGNEAEDGIHESEFSLTPKHAVGNYFDRTGSYVKDPITLDLSEWTRLVEQGPPVLSLHIPGGGKLNPGEVKESLTEATRFFRTKFPDLHFRIFMCHSWLLDTKLSELLPSSSNILAFQSMFTIALANPNDDALFSFVFGVQTRDMDQLSPKNEFQEQLLDYVRSGGRLREGFGVISFPYIP